MSIWAETVGGCLTSLSRSSLRLCLSPCASVVLLCASCIYQSIGSGSHVGDVPFLSLSLSFLARCSTLGALTTAAAVVVLVKLTD